ncbi:MAG: 7,8-didemethyl-8-hydroxy-5-deazariboflavin synthase subunit CofG [Cyanobacteria bacterium]|nr:7,8-didemethyl-8-hydroxy-5-deazariboflavin synthase subunit CofG [Cyanobacteriota bacterium]MDA0866107.1 7,8-didemethyl-8-hydroxy-5-deazariboflavin synthase subunit CofG [Cyanobacteriota bacterium]
MATPVSRVVTYSPALTLVPTYECFNRCQYCNFRVDPGQDDWLSLTVARDRLQWAKTQGVIEVLILSGEVHPQSPRRRLWLERIEALCQLALGMGLLPHSNAGPLSVAEMVRLKRVNVSMGLMLEQVTPTLLKGVHRHAPSKVPTVRLRQLDQAGQLHIPFTTGLLLGIGETDRDRIDTLEAIAQCHRRWGHIQEVILQPHQPGQHQATAYASLSSATLMETIAQARQILPTEITLQVPPNLIAEPAHLLAALGQGARDLGGIGPKDEVNPDYPHPQVEQLRSTLQTQGWQLQRRLPVYPAYLPWLPQPLRTLTQGWLSQINNAFGTPDTHPKDSRLP